MTIILFTVFARKTCSAVSLLPQNFYANFGGDPFTHDRPHDSFMRWVLHRNDALCGPYMTALPEEPRYVMNLKLYHRQMHYRQGSFFRDLRGKTMTKRIENMLPGHEKRKIY